jgi:DNA-binding MarR family transcriptional regulator
VDGTRVGTAAAPTTARGVGTLTHVSNSAAAATPSDSEVRQLTDVVTRLRRALRASIRTDYPWEALPMAQIELMQCLAERDGARVGELAAVLRLRQNTVSGLLQQLASGGMIEREPDPLDRRAVLVRLSEAGAQRLADWQRAHERRIGAALDELGDAQRAAIVAALPALDTLVARLRDAPDDDAS